MILRIFLKTSRSESCDPSFVDPKLSIMRMEGAALVFHLARWEKSVLGPLIGSRLYRQSPGCITLATGV